MKYDSSMTRFHGDIAAAIKSMIYGQEEAVMKLASDGSPAPLREYLKEQHGKCSHGGNKFNCTPQNFSVRFDAIINNLGDKDLTLSWSQVATFIRNNAAEIFPDLDDKSTDDILYYQKNKGSAPNHYSNDYEYKDVPVPTQSEPVAVVFDYSTLDNDTANSLRQCETVIRQETAGYFTLLGAKFKEAQELLANHSSGTFEQWYTAMGFKRQTVYNLIQRFEFSSSPKIEGREDAFEALPLTLSYEISKPTAPAELVDKVLDGDITSNAEYQKLKTELEEANKQLELAKINSKQQRESFDRVANASSQNFEKYQEERHKNQELMKQIKQLNREAEEAEQEYNAIAEREEQYETKICELNRRIKELESRPIDVAVQTDEAALAEKDEEIAELKEQLERLSDKGVKTFAIRMTIDEYERLANIVEKIDDINVKVAVKNARMIRI